MKITLIVVGRLKEKYLKEGIAEYSKRLSRFCELEIIELDDEPAADNLSAASELQVKKKETERVLKRIKEGSILVALDIKGQRFDSVSFADKLRSFFISGHSHITFVIGGSLGIHDSLLKQADLKLSFSDMTFPHQLVRLILVEQVYRAFKIISGEAYHPQF